jgi:hypothetical protein
LIKEDSRRPGYNLILNGAMDLDLPLEKNIK